MESALGELRGKAGLNFLEIGSCEGQSTLWFITEILTHPTSSITCIDPHTEQGDWYNNPNNEHRLQTEKTTYELFKSNILDKHEDKVVYYRAKSYDILPSLTDKFDVIYVDGNHTFPSVYWDGRYSISLLKTGGIIMFDDYWENDNNEMYRAVCELKKEGTITNATVHNNEAVLIMSLSSSAE